MVAGPQLHPDWPGAVWRVPQGVEYASQILTVGADDTNTGFVSVLNVSVLLYHGNESVAGHPRNAPASTWK